MSVLAIASLKLAAVVCLVSLLIANSNTWERALASVSVFPMLAGCIINA
jgi:hypothetical protein